jgi:hypothetical protein
MDRRKFIRKWGRLALLGGMAATTRYFAFSGKISAASSCTDPGKCGSCSVYASCRDSKRQKLNKDGK